MAEIKFGIDIIEMKRETSHRTTKERHQDSVADLEERMITLTRRTPMEDEAEEEVVGLLAVRSSFRGLAFFL